MISLVIQFDQTTGNLTEVKARTFEGPKCPATPRECQLVKQVTEKLMPIIAEAAHDTGGSSMPMPLDPPKS